MKVIESKKFRVLRRESGFDKAVDIAVQQNVSWYIDRDGHFNEDNYNNMDNLEVKTEFVELIVTFTGHFEYWFESKLVQYEEDEL